VRRSRMWPTTSVSTGTRSRRWTSSTGTIDARATCTLRRVPASGHLDRRDIRPQEPRLPDSDQQPRALPTHLVGGVKRSEESMVMFYALPGEERSKTTVMRVVMDMRKPFRNSTEALAPGSYPLRQVPRAGAPERGYGSGAEGRVETAHKRLTDRANWKYGQGAELRTPLVFEKPLRQRSVVRCPRCL
jgi:hypothetical protein